MCTAYLVMTPNWDKIFKPWLPLTSGAYASLKQISIGTALMSSIIFDKAMKGMEICGHHLLIHRHGVIIRLHDWWYSNFDSRQMELSCTQEGVRSLWHGSLELSDTCWQEKLQDHDHYRIPTPGLKKRFS
jgi:hypothetical protein